MPDAHWINKDSIHLTLYYLGPTAEESLAPLHQSLLSIMSEARSIQLIPNGANCFPSMNEAKILWLGIQENQSLIILQEKLAAICQEYSEHRDIHSFHPHITIARFSKTRPFSRGEELIIESWNHCSAYQVPSINLFESRLPEKESRYRIIHQYPLLNPVI